jgi:hypothetical protein
VHLGGYRPIDGNVDLLVHSAHSSSILSSISTKSHITNAPMEFERNLVGLMVIAAFIAINDSSLPDTRFLKYSEYKYSLLPPTMIHVSWIIVGSSKQFTTINHNSRGLSHV